MTKRLLLCGLTFLAGCSLNYRTEILSREVCTTNVHTFRVSLCTKDNRYVVDSVSAENENRARVIMESRYPGCIIYSIQRID